MYGTNENFREAQNLYRETQSSYFQQFLQVNYKPLKYSLVNKKCLYFKKEKFPDLCLHI